MEGDKVHMVAHDTKQIIVFSDKFLIVFKNSSDVPNFICCFSNLIKTAGLCKLQIHIPSIVWQIKYSMK